MNTNPILLQDGQIYIYIYIYIHSWIPFKLFLRRPGHIVKLRPDQGMS